LRSVVNLRILEKRFTQLSDSAYFDPAFNEFLSNTIEVIGHVLENLEHYPDEVVTNFEQQLWNVKKFVSGSRSNDAPYEIQFALKTALAEWINGNPLVSSASLEGLDFFLNPQDIWSFIKVNLGKFDTKTYHPLVVRIGSPELYKHRPVFCIPLFHELGHFIDMQLSVTKLSMLVFRPPPNPNPKNLTDADYLNIIERHRMEFFADLFAACYCNDAVNKTLKIISPSDTFSPTHPMTSIRIATVEDFLAGRKNDTVDMFQNSLKLLGKPNLSIRFSLPDLACFDGALTYSIRSHEELFGLFPASWDYLDRQLKSRDASWVDEESSEFTIEKTVNDLAEKTLRNYEIRQRWENVTPN
jgi:hypothetical protein